MVKLIPEEEKGKLVGLIANSNLTMVKLNPHLETAQSEAKASPRKPKVASFWRSENWVHILSTYLLFAQYVTENCAYLRRFYLRDLACSVRPHHGRHQGRCNSVSIVFDSDLGQTKVVKSNLKTRPLTFLQQLLSREQPSRNSLMSILRPGGRGIDPQVDITNAGNTSDRVANREVSTGILCGSCTRL